MNFPGFISAYRNENGFIELYIFKGIYNDIDMYENMDDNKMPQHNKTINDDGSVIYELLNKKIKRIRCVLKSSIKEIKNKEININI